MSVCVYSLCVVLCVDSGSATGSSPVQGLCIGLRNLKSDQGSTEGRRSIKMILFSRTDIMRTLIWARKCISRFRQICTFRVPFNSLRFLKCRLFVPLMALCAFLRYTCMYLASERFHCIYSQSTFNGPSNLDRCPMNMNVLATKIGAFRRSLRTENVYFQESKSTFIIFRKCIQKNFLNESALTVK
jgi:hypothetical protein